MQTLLYRVRSVALAVVLVMTVWPACAHEYWLDPLERVWPLGDTIQANIRNGENLAGATLPFQPSRLTRAGLISDNHRQPVNGSLGDFPAFQVASKETGLHLLLLETTRRELIYDDYTAFEKFLNSHSLTHIATAHKERDLPRRDIIEHYYRYCKALVSVADSSANSSADNNQPSAVMTETEQSTPAALAVQQQRLELISIDDPMSTDTLDLLLLFEGQPLPERQVELFHRQNEAAEVTRITAFTDDRGRVGFATDANGEYLVNSVHVLAPDSDDTRAHWISLWASLTFRKDL